MDMTKEQKTARTLILMDLMFGRLQLTKQEQLTIIDRPYAEWPEDLQRKTAPLSDAVKVEDERASGQSPAK